MFVEEQDYKFEILEYAVNQCIDTLLPSSSEDALSVILYQSNEVVWKVATEIYTKSGHQIDFLFIRDLLNLRIEPLQRKIAEEERIGKEKEAEEERIRKELEAEEVKLRKQKEKLKQKKLQQFLEVNPNIDIDIFLRIEKIIIEELMVEEEQITLESILSQDLGADDLDAVELISKLEEEFDIEMPDEYELFGIGWSFSSSGYYSTLNPVSVKEIADIVCQKIQDKY